MKNDNIVLRSTESGTQVNVMFCKGLEIGSYELNNLTKRHSTIDEIYIP